MFVPFLGKDSGFKTARDLALFVIGMSIVVFHLVTTPAAKLDMQVLLFGASLATSPYVLRRDERKE